MVHVLVYSPTPVMQRLLSDACESAGYTSTSYPSIEELGEAVLHSDDVALLDFTDRPPDPRQELDLQQIASVIPTVLLTDAFAGLPRNWALRLGAAEVLHTPLDVNLLISTLRRLGKPRPGALDVLDRVLDKGIVIEGWASVSLVGLDLITLEGRVVVASIDTYLKYAPRANAIQWPVGPTVGMEHGERPEQPQAELPSPDAAVRAAEEYLRQLGRPREADR